jgi:hypothetical protein
MLQVDSLRIFTKTTTTEITGPIRCPICDKAVPCVGNFATLYCLALHIAAKWDDEPHLKWRKEHGIVTVVYQSMEQVQTLVRQIMTVLQRPLAPII